MYATASPRLRLDQTRRGTRPGPSSIMTYSSSGPSLAQAQNVDPDDFHQSHSSSADSNLDSHSDTHSHPHAHSHRNYSPHKYNQRQVRRHSQGGRFHHAHGGLHHPEEKRQEVVAGGNDLTPSPSFVTQVIQTVSLVQVVDSVGSPIELRTQYGPPNTIVVDSASGSTVAISNPDPPSSTAAAPGSNAAGSDDLPLSSSPGAAAATPTYVTSASESDPSLSPSPSALAIPSSDDTLSDTPSATLGSDPASQATDLTSSPLVPSGVSSVLPSIGSQNLNSTIISSTSTNINSTTTSTFSTSSTTTSSSSVSLLRQQLFSTDESDSSTSATPSSTAFSTEYDSVTSTWISSTLYSISTEVYTSTDYGDWNGDNGAGSYETVSAVAEPAPTSSSGSDTNTDSTLSPQQKQVIGGVVGSVAGITFLALIILLILRRRKRQGGQGFFGFGGTKSVTDGDPSSGSSAAMTERSASSGVAAALASLTGKRNPPLPVDSGGERGFYRVSGKKLPSVLQAGGDGYSDPRESVISGHSDYWRGSQAFDPAQGPSTRLALGSPMRPVSGVPVIRTGPARTPITEHNPFEDPPPAPRPDSDALGRSLASQDGSRGSTSRFRERI